MKFQHEIERLRAGESVKLRPKGHSMSGLIESGQLVTLEPIRDEDGTAINPLEVGQRVAVGVGHAVLCRVKGRVYLHLVHAVRDGQYQIGNRKGHINGWTTARNIFGRLVRVED